MDQNLILMGQYGKRFILPMDKVLNKLGFPNDEFWWIGIRVEKDGKAFECYTSGDPSCPDIHVAAYEAVCID